MRRFPVWPVRLTPFGATTREISLSGGGSNVPAEKFALYGRLAACLSLLQPTLLEPVPEALKESLTVEDFPTRLPLFEPEADQLGRYCQVLTQQLIGGSLTPDAERVIQDLLGELVSFYADTLKMPRWLRTDEGVIELLA